MRSLGELISEVMKKIAEIQIQARLERVKEDEMLTEEQRKEKNFAEAWGEKWEHPADGR